MYLVVTLVLVLLSSAQCYNTGAAADQCVLTGPCKCEITGQNKYIDLSPLVAAPHQIPLYKTPLINSFSYEWEPCTTTGIPCGKYSSSICQTYNNDPNQKYSVGDVKATFLPGDTTVYRVQYTKTDDVPFTRTAKINLVCNSDSGSGKLTFLEQKMVSGNSADYFFNLESKYCCPISDGGGGGGGGNVTVSYDISIGSILLIIFFVLIIMYLIGGISYNKFYRNRTAVSEVMPNTEFWILLPSLIKDGFWFILRRRPGYEKA